MTSSTETLISFFRPKFIDPFFEAIAPGAAAPGERCFDDQNCSSGACLATAGSLPYCSEGCSDDRACNTGMRCVASHCQWPAKAPGQLGAECSFAFDCVSSLCAHLEKERPAVCAFRCQASTPKSCPEGSSCKPTLDPVDGGAEVTACVADPPPHGCAFAGRRPAGAPWWLFLALLMLARRRRSCPARPDRPAR